LWPGFFLTFFSTFFSTFFLALELPARLDATRSLASDCPIELNTDKVCVGSGTRQNLQPSSPATTIVSPFVEVGVVFFPPWPAANVRMRVAMGA
jgi:hypothetical protein